MKTRYIGYAVIKDGITDKYGYVPGSETVKEYEGNSVKQARLNAEKHDIHGDCRGIDEQVFKNGCWETVESYDVWKESWQKY